jgi:hypothetical protein
MGRAANAVNGFILQHPQQLDLRRRRHVADFIEKEGSAPSHFEFARLLFVRPGEGPLFVPEQFALDQRFRNRSAIHRHERTARARAEPVDGPRHQVLSRPGFSQNQNAEIRLGNPRDLGDQARDRLARTHRLAQRSRVLRLRGQPPQFALQPAFIQGAENHA